MKAKYICAHTKKVIVSEDGLPDGWVVSTSDVSTEADKPIPEKGTVIAFSSQKACDEYKRNLLESKMRSSEFK